MKTYAENSGQCSPPPKVDPPFTATSNVTGEKFLDNCEPWAITIAGGTPPYRLSFVQPDGNVVTNFTLPVEDNTYTCDTTVLFCDVADYFTNFKLPCYRLAAVSDALSVSLTPWFVHSLGRWATNPPVVDMTGNALRLIIMQNDSTKI
ncbi:hypothetical protein BJ165DRAFT_1599148 [Panaeolus papilionaceus]|nr:hypothetical protein BJ165DRAFT_1599148 [Panaeolus papilionaceus]